jgi:hypothetical protein
MLQQRRLHGDSLTAWRLSLKMMHNSRARFFKTQAADHEAMSIA